MDHGFGRLVPVVHICGAVVVPCSEACAGLPRFLLAVGGHAFLHVPYQCFLVLVLKLFAEYHGVEFTAVALHVAVVEMSHYVESRVVDRPEGEHAVVEIYQVGVVVVYHVDGAVEEVVVVLLRGYGGAFGPVPDVPCVAAERVVLHVQFLRVVAFPPFAFAVFFCQNACVVRYSGIRAGLVGSLRCFIPRPRVRGVYAHAEGQVVFAGSLLPFGEYVAFRAHIYRVPALVLAVP